VGSGVGGAVWAAVGDGFSVGSALAVEAGDDDAEGDVEGEDVDPMPPTVRVPFMFLWTGQ